MFFFFISNISSNTIVSISFSSGPTQWRRERVLRVTVTVLLKPCGLWCKKIRAWATLTSMFFNQMPLQSHWFSYRTNSLTLFNLTLLHYNFPSSITTIAQNQSNPLRLHPLEALSIQTLYQINLKTQFLDGDFNTHPNQRIRVRNDLGHHY